MHAFYVNLCCQFCVNIMALPDVRIAGLGCSKANLGCSKAFFTSYVLCYIVFSPHRAMGRIMFCRV